MTRITQDSQDRAKRLFALQTAGTVVAVLVIPAVLAVQAARWHDAMLWGFTVLWLVAFGVLSLGIRSARFEWYDVDSGVLCVSTRTRSVRIAPEQASSIQRSSLLGDQVRAMIYMRRGEGFGLGLEVYLPLGVFSMFGDRVALADAQRPSRANAREE